MQKVVILKKKEITHDGKEEISINHERTKQIRDILKDVLKHNRGTYRSYLPAYGKMIVVTMLLETVIYGVASIIVFL